MKISRRVKGMDASGIRKAFELAKQIKEPINLSIGQPDFTVPDEIKEVARQAIDANRNSYSISQGIDELRDAVAAKLQRKNKIHARKENIVITSAVSGGLSVVLPCLIDHGDEVIIFDPGFVGYKQLVLLYGGVPVAVRKKDDFSIDFEALEKSITSKTRCIIFNTPDNPTGHVSSREEIESLVRLAKRHGLTIISDEIYEDFVYDKKHISIGSLYDNTVTLGGFSKSHAMTGWRMGYVCAPEELAQEIIKVQQFTFVCAPTPFQYAAIKALQADISKYVADYRKKRDIIYEGLKDFYDMIQSDGAFYFFVRYPYDPEKFIKRCLENNLLVVPGNSFSSDNTHFRISFATSEDQLHRAVDILRYIAKE